MIAQMGGSPMVTTLVCRSIAPEVDRVRPMTVDASNKLMAPFAIKVPRKTDEFPRLNAPFTCQKTLQMEAPFIKMTCELLPVVSAPSI